MLVTLGSNSTISAGGSQTFQYACNSFQKLYLRIDDDQQDSLDAHITVQIGNDVICNDINARPLGLISMVNSGGAVSATESIFCVNFGSHVLEPLENLYVTVRNADASATITAVDISCIVNEGGVYSPIKYTNYADKVFTDPNTLSIYAWADADLSTDSTAFTIRNQSYSSTPEVQSGVSIAESQLYVDGSTVPTNTCAILAQNQVPLDTSVNYTSTTIDGVVCVSAMTKQPSKASASKKAGQAVLRAMTSSERKAL